MPPAVEAQCVNHCTAREVRISDSIIAGKGKQGRSYLQKGSEEDDHPILEEWYLNIKLKDEQELTEQGSVG